LVLYLIAMITNNWATTQCSDIRGLAPVGCDAMQVLAPSWVGEFCEEPSDEGHSIESEYGLWKVCMPQEAVDAIFGANVDRCTQIYINNEVKRTGKYVKNSELFATTRGAMYLACAFGFVAMLAMFESSMAKEGSHAFIGGLISLATGVWGAVAFATGWTFFEDLTSDYCTMSTGWSLWVLLAAFVTSVVSAVIMIAAGKKTVNLTYREEYKDSNKEVVLMFDD